MIGINPKKFQGQINIGFLLSVLILLSGCFFYPPRSPLEEHIFRLYDTPEEFQVVSFIEKYDFLDFIPFEENDSRVFDNFSYGLFPHDSFVRNISAFLIQAREHYNSSENFCSGELSYIIDCSLSSSSNLTEVLSSVKEMQNNHKIGNLTLKSQLPISEMYNFAAFLPQNHVPVQIFSSDLSTSYSEDIFSAINLVNLSWVVLIDLSYDWSGTGETCGSYEFTEVILLTSDLLVIGLFSIAGGRIC